MCWEKLWPPTRGSSSGRPKAESVPRNFPDSVDERVSSGRGMGLRSVLSAGDVVGRRAQEAVFARALPQVRSVAGPGKAPAMRA